MIEGIANEVFPIVITAIVGKFDVSWNLIDSGNSNYIMYSDCMRI